MYNMLQAKAETLNLSIKIIKKIEFYYKIHSEVDFLN